LDTKPGPAPVEFYKASSEQAASDIFLGATQDEDSGRHSSTSGREESRMWQRSAEISGRSKRSRITHALGGRTLARDTADMAPAAIVPVLGEESEHRRCRSLVRMAMGGDRPSSIRRSCEGKEPGESAERPRA